jgi:hypothetical protein
MATTLPQWTRTLDNAFTETWYEIRPDAIDNILLATPVWAMLKEKGCFKPQTGSEFITRTVKYAVGVTPVAVTKGDTLPMGVVETETMARWTFRNMAANVQRDTITDAENSGEHRIKDYVKKRLSEARDALVQKYETDVLRAQVTDESGKEIQGLNDLVPLYAGAATGSYGGITRPTAYAQIAAANGVYKPSAGNTWWGPSYKQLTLPYEVNLVTDMKVLYNSIYNNQEAPNFILSDQGLFELYEEFAVDKSQIVKDDTMMLADLGFEVLRFKGKAWTWTPNIAASNLIMLNTDHIEAVYRPNLWFDMSEWKPIPNQTDRVAHILSSCNIITGQPRRHGRLTSATVS